LSAKIDPEVGQRAGHSRDISISGSPEDGITSLLQPGLHSLVTHCVGLDVVNGQLSVTAGNNR
jgi:hypothetical protein